MGWPSRTAGGHRKILPRGRTHSWPDRPCCLRGRSWHLAAGRGLGIIARVPLASGLLSGRYTHGTTFDASDHRTYNRHGEAFDVGETFSGVDFDTGVGPAPHPRPRPPPPVQVLA